MIFRRTDIRFLFRYLTLLQPNCRLAPHQNLGLYLLHVEQVEHEDQGRVFPSTMKAGLQPVEVDNTPQIGGKGQRTRRLHLEELGFLDEGNFLLVDIVRQVDL